LPIGEPIWELYLTLRRVLDITLSTSLEENSCLLLETIVGEMKELYLKLSKNMLKPKFHFLIIYHTIQNNIDIDNLSRYRYRCPSLPNNNMYNGVDYLISIILFIQSGIFEKENYKVV